MIDFVTPVFTAFFCILFAAVSFGYYKMIVKGFSQVITFFYLIFVFSLTEAMVFCSNFLLEKEIYVELGHADIGIILLSAVWLLLFFVVVLLAFIAARRNAKIR